MGKRGHSEEEILRVLREAEAGQVRRWSRFAADMDQRTEVIICGRRGTPAWV